MAQVAFGQAPPPVPAWMQVPPEPQLAPPPPNPYPPANPTAVPPPAGQFVPPPGSPTPAPLVDQVAPLPVPYQLPPAVVPSPAPPSADAASVPITLPKPKSPPKLWEGGLELGLDGSEGNSQTFNLHFGAKVKRKTECNILSSELDYKQNRSDSVETANKAFLDSRFEHLFHEARWTWFVHNIEDYDEFKAYDLRVSLDSGCGYRLIKSDITTLTGRLGAGTTKEIGGPNDRFIPEAVFGLEGEHQLSKRQKLTASIEYRPDVTDFTDYRMNSKVAWEVLLDEEKHLSMKVGLLDRYDSNAGSRKPNDLDYSLTLLWGF